MTLELKEDFTILEDGTSYLLPTYHVVDGVGIERTGDFAPLDFVRGSKIGTEDVQRHVGTLHEHLLSVMIHDMKYKNDIVPSRESALAITKLEEALHWIRARQIDRTRREVQGTYKQ